MSLKPRIAAALLAACTLLSSGCGKQVKENAAVVKEEAISWPEPIAYAFYNVSTETSSNGRTKSWAEYLKIGIVRSDGTIESVKCAPDQKVYQFRKSMVVHHAVRYTYQDGSCKIESVYDEVFLNPEMFKMIGGKPNE